MNELNIFIALKINNLCPRASFNILASPKPVLWLGPDS